MPGMRKTEFSIGSFQNPQFVNGIENWSTTEANIKAHNCSIQLLCFLQGKRPAS